MSDQWGFAQGSDYFIMVVVSDKDQRIAFLGKFYGFDVDFGHKWAGGVDDPETAASAVLTYFG